MELKRYSQISPARQRLVEIIESLGFGTIELDVAHSEPSFDPPPKILQDIKIGGVSEPRTESVHRDFALTSKIVELFEHLDRLASAKVKVEVKHSQPFRLTIERTGQQISCRYATEELG
jgi:hypothetical protein